MTYFGRYKKPHDNWSQWLEFSGHDDALRHCGTMAAGRDFEILSEDNYNLEYGEKPSPQVTDSTGAFERLIKKPESPESIEHVEEDSSQDIESPEQGSQEEQREERGPGRPRIDRPARDVLQKLYVDEGKSLRAIAKELGLSRDFIHAALKEYGIETRSTFKPSKLAQFPLGRIKERVRVLGYEKAAREFGVGMTTLYHYVKTH